MTQILLAASNTREGASVEEVNRRLRVRIVELLNRNEELHWKVAALEARAAALERGLEGATAWAGMLF